jgi:exonuclease VII large subunit
LGQRAESCRQPRVLSSPRGEAAGNRPSGTVEQVAGSLPGLSQLRGGLERNFASLSALGPQATLDRGYAVVRRRSDARIVRGPEEAPPGQQLIVQVARGEFAATADEAIDVGTDHAGGG